MNVGAAISKPFSNIGNLVIGIILLFIPIINFLVIPGYLLRLANKTMNKDQTLPGFDNFGELIVNSIKAIVVGIVYSVILLVLTFILAFIPLIGPILIIILMIVFMFIELSAMMTLAKTGDIGAALGIKSVAARAANGGFIASVIVGAIIAGIIAVIVAVILGILLGASLIPIIMTQGQDPTAIMTTISALIGTFLIGIIVLVIIGYALMVFFYSLVAESYPQ